MSMAKNRLTKAAGRVESPRISVPVFDPTHKEIKNSNSNGIGMGNIAMKNQEERAGSFNAKKDHKKQVENPKVVQASSEQVTLSTNKEIESIALKSSICYSIGIPSERGYSSESPIGTGLQGYHC